MARLYVGHKKETAEIFRHPTIPKKSDGLPYFACTGPFRTIGGAKVMVNFGRRNPHAQTVGECEEIAKSLDMRNYPRRA